jgi:hypothetical protein
VVDWIRARYFHQPVLTRGQTASFRCFEVTYSLSKSSVYTKAGEKGEIVVVVGLVLFTVEFPNGPYHNGASSSTIPFGRHQLATMTFLPDGCHATDHIIPLRS